MDDLSAIVIKNIVLLHTLDILLNVASRFIKVLLLIIDLFGFA